MFRIGIFSLLFLAGVANLKAQLPVAPDTATVFENVKVLKMAWAGGLNSCMFSQIDLNQDGKQDLVVFDKVDNYMQGIFRCFINQGSSGQIKYVYDASYNSKFPRVEQWNYFYDYNSDGKADLFTYRTGGIKVYKNTSPPGDLSFQLVNSFLKSNSSPTATASWGNIFTSPFSIPGFTDMDGDGDMDILAFTSLGYQMEYHKNMRVEKSLSADSLHFEIPDETWGNISENNCLVNLNQFIVKNAGGMSPMKTYHSGACIMCFDRDGDNDQDLILGDISCDYIHYCENTGNSSVAHISDTTALYPNYPTKANTQIVKMNNFPCTFYLDIDNDGKKDLVASPNISNSENFQSVWYYKNISSGPAVDFQFVKKNFLQEDMMDHGDGSYPALADIDSDGKLDLVAGNQGYYNINGNSTQLTYYRNIGTTTQPSFSLMTRDFANLTAHTITYSLGLGAAPTFGDIDGDGDTDMLIGDNNGRIHWMENTAGAGNPCNFSIFKKSPFSFTTASTYATPQLVDVDRDSKLDLLIGMENGRIAYYRNIGTTTSPVFSLITSTFGNINMKDMTSVYGADAKCAPFMFDVGGTYRLLCGHRSGNIYYYSNIDGNLNGTFTRLDSLVNKINDGPRAVLQYTDINGDTKPDMILGNWSGGLSFYSSKSPLIGIDEMYQDKEQISVYPNPVQDKLEIRSLDLLTEKMQISLMDLTGKTVFEQEINSDYSLINCSGFSKGIYILKVNYFSGKGSSCSYKKIILQ